MKDVLESRLEAGCVDVIVCDFFADEGAAEGMLAIQVVFDTTLAGGDSSRRI